MLKYILSGVLATASFLAAEEAVLKFTPRPAAERKFQFVNAAKSADVVLPYLGDGKNPDWKRAWRSPDFTMQRAKAVALAKGFQAAGEWKHFLPQTLIPQQRTFLEAGWIDNGVIVRITAFQKYMERVLKVPVKYGRDGNVYQHENIDMGFAVNRNNPQYFQVITDVRGNTYDARQIRGGKGDLSWNPDWEKKVEHLPDRWILTMVLPLKSLGFKVKKGEFFDLNAGRVELTRGEVSSMGAIEERFNEADKMVRFWFSEKRPLPVIQKMSVVNPFAGKSRLELQLANLSSQPFSGTVKFGTIQRKIELAPKQSRTLRFDFAGNPGKNLLQAELQDRAGIPFESASLAVEIPPELQLRLSSNEIIAGNTVSGTVQCCTQLKKGSIEIAYAGRKSTFPLTESVSFTINTKGVSGKHPVIVSLKDGQGKTAASAQVLLNIPGDPFADDAE